MPKPKVEIDLDEFYKLCRLQCTQEEIAAWFGVSESTIARRVANVGRMFKDYRDAWTRGRAEGRISVRRAQFQAMLAGDKTMLVWLGKQLLEQKDSVKESTKTIRIQDARKTLVDEITEYLIENGSPAAGPKAGSGEK
jgi:hypothetical protein